MACADVYPVKISVPHVQQRNCILYYMSGQYRLNAAGHYKYIIKMIWKNYTAVEREWETAHDHFRRLKDNDAIL